MKARSLMWLSGVVMSGCFARYAEPEPPPPEAQYAPPPYQQPYAQPPQAYQAPPPEQSYPPSQYSQPQAHEQEPEYESIETAPPVGPPQPVAVYYAPPAMRWDPPPPQPFYSAVWVGGYWHWEDGMWFWSRGRWMAAPSVQYVWAEPYYEYRGTEVIYLSGYWRRYDEPFRPPPPNIYIAVSPARPGVYYARPVGPYGVFVPAPPGSRAGVIVPAPVGTSPSVVVSSPPVMRPGMVVQAGPRSMGGRGGPQGMVVVAPAGVTTYGAPVHATVPAQAHLAMAQRPVMATAAGIPPPRGNVARLPSPAQGRSGMPNGAATPERSGAPGQTFGAQQPSPFNRNSPERSAAPGGAAQGAYPGQYGRSVPPRSTSSENGTASPARTPAGATPDPRGRVNAAPTPVDRRAPPPRAPGHGEKTSP